MSSKKKTGSDGFLIVLSAPSGCGKTTVVDRLLMRHADWQRSVSVTTRKQRPGEKHGEDYFFVTMEEFEAMKSRGELLEYAPVFDHYYGTPKKAVMDAVQVGKRVILAIDVQGVQSIMASLTDKRLVASIFIIPPSVKILRERLENRNTETPEQIDRRIEAAQEEIKAASLYEFTVMNQNIEQTVQDVEDRVRQFEENRRN